MRIFDDIGAAFTMGAIGGGVWHGVAGFRQAAKVCINVWYTEAQVCLCAGSRSCDSLA